jgi:UDP-N-acetylglucosamine--N-acetylmuramyl-(pentapeptide) pyrophosphoryl-undecaprenol N-acetylglucosamine transferase
MEQRKTLSKKIIVTGGGSGGHVSVSSALIDGLKEKFNIPYENLLYIGGDLGMVNEKHGESIEQKRFKNADFQTEYIRAGKLQRTLSIKGVLLTFRTILGFTDSFKIINKFKPDIIISTGGFVSVPVCIAAHFKKIPIYLHEQTAAIGLSNKIVSKFAEKIFVTFEESIKYFPKEKTFHTGNVVRKAIFQKNGEGEIIKPLKKMIEKQEKYPIIYISGGGQGSHIINTVVRESLPLLLQNFQIVLQTGDNQEYKDYNLCINDKSKLSVEQQERFLPIKYILDKEIGFLFSNIDMYAGRSGANTAYEMGVMAIPSIFIPIPWVTHNEQEKNAKVLADLGIAEILPEGELSREQLVLSIKNFWNMWKHKRESFNFKDLKKKFPTDAVEKILNEIEELK